MKEKQKIIQIADLGFGDAGKGSLTDFLCREFNAHTVIRYNGGAQAGHNVISPDGSQHIFSQFGSGTLEGAKTHLSHFMLVDPLSMLKEEQHLKDMGINDAFQKTTIDGQCPVITPFHQASNRLLVLNTENSTGRGVSEAMADYLKFGRETLMVEDLLDAKLAKKKLKFLRDIQQEKIKDLREGFPDSDLVRRELKVLDSPRVVNYSMDLYKDFIAVAEIVDRKYLKSILNQSGSVIFEGAQGVLLDQKYGFYPYITRGNTTFENADELLLESDYKDEIYKMGVIRVYATRHGAGPFPTEDKILTNLLPDTSNLTNPWQGNFRVGHLDLVTLSYALEVLGSLDGLAITHLDKLRFLPEWKICTSYISEEGNLITKIEVNRQTDNIYQQKLGEMLQKCKPNYILSRTQNDPSEFIQFISDQIKVPVVVTSSGPKATDKTINI